MALRSYQKDALQNSLSRFQQGVRRQLLVLPTGTGKTVIFANLREHFGFTNKILVLVHREELAQQAAEKIAYWNPDCMVGVEMGPLHSSPMDDIIVGSVPTLGRSGSSRLEKLDPRIFDAVVCDEAHHSTAQTYKNVFQYFGLFPLLYASPLLVGVTATPNRSDGTGLCEIYDEIVYDMDLISAIRQGWLADLKGIRVQTTVSLDEVKIRQGDFAVDQLSDAVNTSYRNGVVVKEWVKSAAGKQTIAFCVDIKHAQDLAKEFRDHGINCEAVWGDDPDRADKLKKHRNREIIVLTNCAVLTEGYDDWRIECIVMARPTKSPLLYTQMAGRGTRIPDGIDNIKEAKRQSVWVSKDSCLLIDVIDNCVRNTLVTTPSLFGMNVNMQLHGESAEQARQRMDDAARDYPYSDLSNITDLSMLDSIATSIDLFQVSYPPEVEKLSELAWRKLADGNGYFITVPEKELVEIKKDLRDEYRIFGSVEKQIIDLTATDIHSAFSLADAVILSLGGVKILLKRKAGWHNDPPSPKQLALCKKLGIYVPATATKGDVSRAIDRRFLMK